MTVGDLQKYLRGLADAIGAAKGPYKELEEAAAALAPFAHHKLAAFAQFLQLAEAKYSATGELPDGKPVKQPKAPAAPKPDKPTPAAFVSKIEELKAVLSRNERLDRPAVETELNKFATLTQAQVDEVMKGLKFPTKFKKKADALAAIVTHILAEQTAVDRVKV